MIITRGLAVAVALALAAVQGAGAQGGTGQIQGIARAADSGMPVQNVNVVVIGTRFAATTQTDGRYTITGVPEGAYQVRAPRIGYLPRELSGPVTSGHPASPDFLLSATRSSLHPALPPTPPTPTRPQRH